MFQCIGKRSVANWSWAILLAVLLPCMASAASSSSTVLLQVPEDYKDHLWCRWGTEQPVRLWPNASAFPRLLLSRGTLVWLSERPAECGSSERNLTKVVDGKVSVGGISFEFKERTTKSYLVEAQSSDTKNTAPSWIILMPPKPKLDEIQCWLWDLQGKTKYHLVLSTRASISRQSGPLEKGAWTMSCLGFSEGKEEPLRLPEEAQPAGADLLERREARIPRLHRGWFKLEETRRLVILPASSPPTRTVCNLDELSTGKHLEVVWDPSEGGALAKTMAVPQGTWQVSFSAMPLQHPANAFANLAWSEFAFVQDFYRVSEGEIDNPPKAFALRQRLATEGRPKLLLEDCDAVEPAWECIPVRFTWGKLESFEIALERMGERGSGASPAVTTARGRSFSGSADALAGEVLHAVVDVTLDRAEAQALRVVRERFLTLLCDGLLEQRLLAVLNRSTPDAPATITNFRLLRETCSSLGSMRLRELAGAGQQLRTALTRDSSHALHFVMSRRYPIGAGKAQPWLGGIRPEVLPVVAALGGFAALAVTESIGSSREADLARAQLLLNHFSEVLSKGDLLQLVNGKLPSNIKDEDAVVYALLVTAGGVAWCGANGRCDTATIRKLVSNPESFFNASGLNAEVFKSESYKKLSGRVESLMLRGVSVMSPPADAEPRTVLASSVDFMLDSALLLLETQGSAPGDQEEIARERQVLEMTRRVASTVLSEDPQSQAAALAALVGALMAATVVGLDQDTSELSGRFEMLGALASYVSTYAPKPGESASALEAQRAARKQALSALVDLATDRTHRRNTAVFSIGGAVHLNAVGLRWGHGDFKSQYVYGGQPSLDLGLGLQQLGRSGRSGFMAQIALLDPGQYIAWDKNGALSGFKGSAISVIGLKAGYHWDNFFVAADVRYTPFTQVTDVKLVGAWSTSLSAGVYVPLFDLN